MFDRRERIACVSLGYVEAVAALSRRLTADDLARVELRLKLDWENMTRLQITGDMIDQAANLARQYKLRGADAVHLATALDLHRVLADINEPVVLVASDDELLEAARAAGLQVENPLLQAQTLEK